MKYKLIHAVTKEEHICDKITVDDFDYYVNNTPTKFIYIPKNGIIMEQIARADSEEYKSSIRIFGNENHKFILCTNNPDFDLPKVINVGAKLCKEKEEFELKTGRSLEGSILITMGFALGYTKSQETHPFTEDDMTEFLQFYKDTARLEFNSTGENHGKSNVELLDVWRLQRIKTVYYE